MIHPGLGFPGLCRTLLLAAGLMVVVMAAPTPVLADPLAGPAGHHAAAWDGIDPKEVVPAWPPTEEALGVEGSVGARIRIPRGPARDTRCGWWLPPELPLGGGFSYALFCDDVGLRGRRLPPLATPPADAVQSS